MKSKFFWFGGIIVLLIALGVTSAVAEDTVTYYACVNDKNGSINIINEEETCKKNESRISWNEQGPKGDQGEIGPEGPAGPQGDQGIQGEQGNNGIHCWDLNMDGIKDPGEDTNGDSEWDSLDCRGPQGEPGVDPAEYYTIVQVDALLAEVNILLSDYEARIIALEKKLASVTIENSGQDVVFTGVNVHVRNGTGSTYETLNGLGNLIVGYNKDYFENDRTGSHNLVIGDEHTYSSSGGFVAGIENTISGPYSSVCGGVRNTASSEASHVSGGVNNTASWWFSSVTGGQGNTASGHASTASGGAENTASGWYSTVIGGGGNYEGGGNDAQAFFSVVVGGDHNTAEDLGFDGDHASVVVGGYNNTASGQYSSISGGLNRVASGNYDWVAGGLFQDE